MACGCASGASATLAEGERIDYSLPLHGPAPSFTVSWEDTLGQAGALTFEEAQLPYPPAGQWRGNCATFA